MKRKQPKIYYTKIGRSWATWSQDVAPVILEVSSKKEAAEATKLIAIATGRKYAGYALTKEQSQEAKKRSAARDRLARQQQYEQRQKSLSSSEPWDYVPDEDDDTSWYLQHI